MPAAMFVHCTKFEVETGQLSSSVAHAMCCRPAVQLCDLIASFPGAFVEWP